MAKHKNKEKQNDAGVRAPSATAGPGAGPARRRR